MWSRLYFLAALIFFAVMNLLLWRSEFTDKEFSAALPLQTVLHHLLVSSDDSHLEIRQEGRKIGYGRWAPSIISAPPSATAPEGMVSGIQAYSLDFDGGVRLDDDNRLRFSCALRLGTNQVWQELHVRLVMRHWSCEMLSRTAEDLLLVTLTEDQNVRKHTFKLSELKDPAPLLRALGGPLLADAIHLLGLPFKDLQPVALASSLRWTASTDRQKVGRTPIQVFRIQGQLFDQFKIVAFVLESGEIMRVELPNDIVLINDELAPK